MKNTNNVTNEWLNRSVVIIIAMLKLLDIYIYIYIYRLGCRERERDYKLSCVIDVNGSNVRIRWFPVDYMPFRQFTKHLSTNLVHYFLLNL